MKLIVISVFLKAALIEACLEKVPSVQIQNYDGPIFLLQSQKQTCENNPLYNPKATCESDCTCVAKVPKYHDISKCDNNMYGNFPNYYDTKMCKAPYDVPKICDINCYDVPKVCKLPNYFEIPKSCTGSNYYPDSKFDISKYYDQYYQQQKRFLNKEGCQKVGLLEAKVKVGVFPDSFNSADDSRSTYGYKCADGDSLYNYSSQGYDTTCLCKKCGGYISI